MAIVTMIIRTWRWQILLRDLKNISYKRVFSFTMIGFMANNILPAHTGELVRAFYLGRKERISVVSTFTTVFIERLFDFIAVTLFLLVIIHLVTIPIWLKHIAMGIGILSLLLTVLLMIMASKQGAGVSFFYRLTSKLPEKIKTQLQAFFNSFLTGIKMLHSKKDSFYIFLISLFLWAQITVAIYILLWGYGLNTDLTLASITVMIFSVFAVAIPSAPGYFGVLELAFVIALSIFYVEKPDALACSVIYHLTQYIPITLGGVIFLFKEGLSFKAIAIDHR
jgi:uncharacterized protein (TIRG00374 family)